MSRQLESILSRLRRGHVVTRLTKRAVRELQSISTTLTLTASRPRPGHAAIVTLNADEENATVQAVVEGQNADTERILFVSPDPAVSSEAVARAARRLDSAPPTNIEYRTLTYGALLSSYRVSVSTFSTHVLLPGRDLSKRRTHTHLTHGSGPKPDTTFRGPTNVLASITPQWVEQQLREYQLPPDTPVVEYQPRLEVMRRAATDRSVLEKLGFDPSLKLTVWAPTYRSIVRAGGEVRVSGVPFTDTDYWGPRVAALVQDVEQRGHTFVAKVHPHDADSLRHFGVFTFKNTDLSKLDVSPYELFGVADNLITDYSSIYAEREYLGLPFACWAPDERDFNAGYRGFR
ncbi:CDP-glycerol glycerophosphotransferase family protein [Leucobacter sp. HY1910]